MSRPALPLSSESAILRACLDLLRAHPKVGLAWRCNTGGMSDSYGHHVRFGFKGQSDLMAVLKPSGRLLAVEVKRKGKRPTLDQNAFLEAVAASGGHGIWIDDPAKLADYLRRV